MQVEDLTLVVELDDVSFPFVFSSWGDSFLCCVRHLQFDFLGDHLDMEEASNIGLFSISSRPVTVWYMRSREGRDLDIPTSLSEFKSLL